MYRLTWYEELIESYGTVLLHGSPHTPLLDFDTMYEMIRYIQNITKTRMYRNKPTKYCELLDEVVYCKHLNYIEFFDGSIKYSYTLDSPTYVMSEFHHIGLREMKDVTYNIHFIYFKQ